MSWPLSAEYKIAEAPGIVTITFDHGGHAELSANTKQALRNVQSITAADDDQHLVVMLTVKPGSHVRAFKAGNIVIVDLMDGDSGTGAPAPVDIAASSGQKTEIARPGDTLIHIAPTDPLSLAAFRRGPYLWIAADGKLPSATPSVTGLEAGTLADPSRYAGSGATYLRYRIADTDHVSARPQGIGWDIVLSPDAPGSKGLDVEGRIATEQVRVSALGATKVLSFTDPDLGDTMRIVPLPGTAEFVDRDRHLPEGDLIATAEGVVFLAKGNPVIAAGSNAVTISGLNLSGDIGTSRAAPPPLYDFAAWRAGGPSEILKRRKAIEHAGLTDSDAGTRGTAIDLAHLYLANGFGNEALGALDFAATADPGTAEKHGLPRASRGGERAGRTRARGHG